MKILIPSHCLEFTGEVQQVLLLAAEQGFNISNIELGVSPTQCIELVDTETSRLYSNLFELSGDGDLESKLTFLYGGEPQEVCLPNVVQIGVSYDERLVDSWLHLDETTLLIHSQSLSSNQSWRHFAWIVASLALDFPLEDALVLSRAAMNVSRETWPTQFQHFPFIEQPAVSIAQTGFTILGKQSLGLYPVVDNVEWIERLLKLGIKTIQLRIKDPSEPSLERQIVKAIRLGREHKAQVFINDYWQLALKHKAFGVHLGQEDVLDADLELIAESRMALGLSTHGYFELLRIHQLSLSYIALGHIFPTTTKQMPSKPQGLVRLGLYQKLLDSMPYGKSIGVPSVAIGGIDLDNIQPVLDQGVSSIAVVRAITEAKNVEANVKELQSKISQTSNRQEVSMLSDNAFLRYQRQVCLPEIGESGQQKLCDSSVLIIGCGGLGNSAALYLAAAGVGKLVLCDNDEVEVSNLSRQIAFRNHHVSTPKVEALAQQLRALNPECHIRTVQRRADKNLLPLEVSMADVVLDCSDNLETRHLVNQVCFECQVPLISGAAIGWSGQVIAFDFTAANKATGCYACMVPRDYTDQLGKCSDLGIIGPVVGTIGNLQALLAILYLAELPEFKTHQLMTFDAKHLDWQKWQLMADPDCEICAAKEANTNNNEGVICPSL